MKISRIAAAGTAFLIAGASVLAGGTAAVADDFYVNASQLTATETSPYPAGWFRGNVTGTPGTITSGPAGLTATGGAFQLLNGSPAATDLTTVDPDILLSAGTDATFQIPLFTTPGAGYTTIYATAAQIATDTWTTTTARGSFAINSQHTLAEYQAEFPTLQILAFGFYKNAGATTTVASLDWNGDTYWFLPTPTTTVAANPITPTAFAANGVVITSAGFIPGETVDIGIGYGQGGDTLATVVADANGVATYTFTPAAGELALTPGTYSLGGFGNTSGANSFATLTVALAAPALAATGTDSIAPVAAGGVLLLGGALALVLVTRRRQAEAL